MPENISNADDLANELINVKNTSDIEKLKKRIKDHLRIENPITLARRLVYYASDKAKGLPPVRIDGRELNYLEIAEQIAKDINSVFQQAITRAAFAYKLKFHAQQLKYIIDDTKHKHGDDTKHNLGDYVFELFEYYKIKSARSSELKRLLCDLKLELSFNIYLDELFQYCERDTILKLFNISGFKELPGNPNEIQKNLQNHLKSLLLNFFVVVAQIIKGKEELNNKEREDMDKLTEHVIGVYTSLLQLYYMETHEESKFDRLYVGGDTVAARLREIFREHYPVDDALQFKKWAFIVLFHDIGKFEETLPGYNRKHDLVSAEIIQDWGILYRLSEMTEDDKQEISLIIKKHVDVGCHGPADHSIIRLYDLFYNKNVDDRIGRIISAWANNPNLRDYEAKNNFQQCLKELVDQGEIVRDDRDTFDMHFYCISGANHIFNMLVLPVRNKDGYKNTVKGLVLLTKAAVELKVNEIRAVNIDGVMELDASKREKMAELLVQAVSRASSVKGKGTKAWFVDNTGQRIKRTNVKMSKHVEGRDSTEFLMVQIEIPPAAKTLFIKRVLDSQKFFIGKVWILFFSSCPFV